MTSSDCRNGTERCAEALEQLGHLDIVVNVQGDSPLTPPWFVTALVDGLAASDADVATPVLRCDARAHARLREDRAAGRVGGTTAVFGRDGDGALLLQGSDTVRARGHRGAARCSTMSASTPTAPRRSVATWRSPPGTLEEIEGLEQLRFLEIGDRVLCVEVQARGRVFWELNNPVDVARIEEVL